MIIKVLDHTGHTTMTDSPVTTEGIENVKEMTSAELEKEFNSFVKKGFTPIDDSTNKVMKGFLEVENVTMLYPVIGG